MMVLRRNTTQHKTATDHPFVCCYLPTTVNPKVVSPATIHYAASASSMYLFDMPRFLLFLTALSLGNPVRARVCHEQERRAHPVLCHMLQWAEDDLDHFVQEAQSHAAQNGLLVDWENMEMPTLEKQRLRRLSNQLPVVLAHGMGDSCFNGGMQHITERASKLLGDVYTTCIPTGRNQAEDTKNGYFLSMDDSVDVFAAAVAADPQLQNGFHAIGLSQGNNVIRGYIARYNTPSVHTFISINGVNAGEGAVPNCFPSGRLERTAGDWCDYLMEQASHRAYTEFAQKHSFQANYWRDPRSSAFPQYQKFSQLAKVCVPLPTATTAQ